MSDNAAQLELQDRVNSIIAWANAARSSGNPIDLDTVRMELDKVALSTSDGAIAVMQSYIQGDLSEHQTRQLVQTITVEEQKKVTAQAQPEQAVPVEQPVFTPTKESTAISPDNILKTLQSGAKSLAG